MTRKKRPSPPTLAALVAALDAEMQGERFQDDANNGLQVACSDKPIRKVCCGVDASLACFEAAAAQDAEREADLARRRPGQELTQRDEVRVFAVIDPAPTLDEFGAEVPEMGDGPAERGQSEPQERPEDLAHRAVPGRSSPVSVHPVPPPPRRRRQPHRSDAHSCALPSADAGRRRLSARHYASGADVERRTTRDGATTLRRAAPPAIRLVSSTIASSPIRRRGWSTVVSAGRRLEAASMLS